MDQFVSRYVVVRAHMAGVVSGVCAEVVRTGDTICVTLTEGRKLHRWWVALPGGQGMEGLCAAGLAERSEVQCSAPATVVVVAGVCQMGLCTPEAERSMRTARVWQG